MFGTVRSIIWCISFGVTLFLVSRPGKVRPFIAKGIALLLSFIITALSVWFPIENFFYTFSSPESVYEYYYSDSPNSIDVIPGRKCDLVIGRGEVKNTFMFAPKSVDGWKIGNGLNLKIMVNRGFDGILVQVYKYRATDDYFVLVMNTDGGALNISDAYDSGFDIIERGTLLTSNGESLIEYWTNIGSPDPEYWIWVDGKTIFPFSES